MSSQVTLALFSTGVLLETVQYSYNILQAILNQKLSQFRQYMVTVGNTMASIIEFQVNHSNNKGHDDLDRFVPWDNPDNVITFETYSTMDNILVCYLNPLMLIIGVPANVLSCVVFFRQGSGILPSSSSSPSLLFSVVFFLVYFLFWGINDRGRTGSSLLTPLMIR